MTTLLLLLMLGAPATPERTLRLADGLEMAYVEKGKGEPALVFVHCGNCRKEIWRETLDAFQGEHRVVPVETNRKYAPSFQMILMEGVGHYPQVERPAEFQDNLRRVLRSMGPSR